MSRPLHLLLATGGTGGHIYPALAVARAALEQGDRVTLMGQRGGMEERLVAEAGLPFVGVSAGKWNRGSPDPREAFKALAGPIDALRWVRRERPDLVIGFGGFASFPGCVAATLTGTPLVLHEGNAYPSRVNRWFAARARLVVVAQEEALRHLHARRSVTLPFPVRERLLDRQEARAALGLPADAVVTLVMGGSQGSLALNRSVPDALQTLRAREGTNGSAGNLHVLHASGPRWEAELRERTAGLPNYHVHAYLDAAAAWAAADVAITRAGVGTLSEAAYAGVPLLMVPLPSSAEDHQLHNARAVAAAGAGLVVEERHLATLPEVWLTVLQASWRESAAAAARGRSPEGAARRIYAAAHETVGSA